MSRNLAMIACVGFIIASVFVASVHAQGNKDDATVKAEHGMIGLGKEEASARTQHPDAQWFGDAAFGLFLHWDISSVRAMNISWPMIPGRPLGAKRIEDSAERERIIREGDWNLTGRKPEITPNEYFAMAKDFNPQNYDPDKWCQAAKEAGFTYIVLTTKHHSGFAMWPSEFGEFNTKNYMGGRDLVRPFVEACRRHGLKVGLYLSGPDWYFDKDHFSFLYHGARRRNPEFPNLGPDLQPRELSFTPEQTKEHQAEYAALVKGQVEELLTNYGKIDLLWFDGKPSIPDGDKAITIERIRALQPGIVVNPRMHGKGDFITYERTLKTDKVASVWAEFCNTWASNWSYVKQPMKDNAYVLGQLATSRSLGINYLLGIGPMSDGDFSPDHYKNLAVVAKWMKANGQSIHGAGPLPSGESASVPATAEAAKRFLFAIPKFEDGGTYAKDRLPPEDLTLTLRGVNGKPSAVTLLGDGTPLDYEQSDDGTIAIKLPATKRTDLIDVVKVDLQFAGSASRAP